MASGPEHYAEAERLLDRISASFRLGSEPDEVAYVASIAAVAQAHATLAQAAAIVDASDIAVESDWGEAVDDSPELQAKKSREFDRRQRETREPAERDRKEAERKAQEPQDAPVPEPQDAPIHEAELPGGTCAEPPPHPPHPWRNVEGTPLYCPGKVRR